MKNSELVPKWRWWQWLIFVWWVVTSAKAAGLAGIAVALAMVFAVHMLVRSLEGVQARNAARREAENDE